LAFGDRAEVPVFLTNLSGRTANLDVTLAAEALAVPGLVAAAESGAPIEVEGGAARKLSLADGASGTVVFRILSKRAVGAAKLKVRASEGDLSSEESLDVPFIPAAPRTREVHRVELVAGRTDLKKYLAGWLPTTEKTTVWVTNNPYG